VRDGWVVGDLQVAFPAHAAALRDGGVTFLTNAFHASGALGEQNRVGRITRCEEVPGGSTGRKLLLDVEYDKPQQGLPTALFVKFSRDFDDPIRDRGRTQMDSEVRFAALTAAPGFPISVPRVQFTDYHRDSGTGVLISERIQFGVNGIEPQYHKCLDYEMPDPLEHYRALLTAVARLAGTHRSASLPAGLTEQFPVDLRAATVGEPQPLTPDRLHRKLTRLAEFADAHPGLLPANVRSPQFLRRLGDEVHDVIRHEDTIWRRLAEGSDYIALCHWNANVDNAWFWRGDDNDLRCGLMDWGCVSQMNIAMAIWGAMSGAETAMWDRHLDELLALVCTEVQLSGGPKLDVETLAAQVMVYAALMGATWLLDVPAMLRARISNLGPTTSRTDPRIKDDEGIRAPLQMFVNFLNLWESRDFSRVLAELAMDP
jgi:hypothetical protein